jgi:hypothetical protein
MALALHSHHSLEHDHILLLEASYQLKHMRHPMEELDTRQLGKFQVDLVQQQAHQFRQQVAYTYQTPDRPSSLHQRHGQPFLRHP